MPDPDHYRARIVRLFAVLETAEGGRTTLPELAAAAGMSPFHLHRVFRAVTGETIGAVAKRFRLARGLRLLRDSERPITEVALEVGYDTPQNFARAFKAASGRTPSEVRDDPDLTARVLNGLGKPRFVPMKDFSATNVTIEDLPAMPAIGIRHIGPPAGLGVVFPRLMGWIASHGLVPSVRAICTVYQNDAREVPAAEFEAIACAVLGTAVEPGDGMEVVELGGGPHACLVHEGSYEGLGHSYDALYGRWLPASGREPADRPPFEKYINDPSTTPVDDLRTAIYLPLA